MGLPKPSTPIYYATLPSSKKEIEFRPFLVKDQKAIVVAMQEDDKSAIRTVLNVLDDCILTKNVFVKDLPLIDVEVLLMKVRQKSVGEIVQLVGSCECGASTEFDLNLEEVQVENLDISNNDTIQIDSSIIVKFKRPTVDMLNVSASDNKDDFIATCIEEIYDGDNVYSATDYTKSELIDFIEALSSDQYAKIDQYFDNQPKLKKEVSYKCNKCGAEHNITLEGLNSFFM